ncbi:Cytochrome P450 [Penicillium taxi]|uniref:Cytochrome P450 n=1 Tax=Penicillium taxi TaxID=168475 RepID=UPI002544ED7C|nr:Cytochrome P450 [Penicillium taxi]KAJ5888130.1 Cytochrome P450 [Penicillium taxi]
MGTASLFVLILPVLSFCGLYRILYNVFFHPLRKFPGPWMAGATSCWRAYKEVIKQETLAQEPFTHHKKYVYHSGKRWDKDKDFYRTPGIKSGTFVLLIYAQAKERQGAVLPIFFQKAVNSLEHLVWCNVNNPLSNFHHQDKRDEKLYRPTLRITLPRHSHPWMLAFACCPLNPDLIFAVPPTLVIRFMPQAQRLAPRLYLVKQLHVVLKCPSKLDTLPHQTIFYRMLDPQAYRSKKLLDLTALHDEGFTLIFAGSNTVADTLLMGYWHLMQNQILLAELRREIMTVWPVIAKQPLLTDLETLSLLTATIKEALSFIPSGVSLTRVVPIGGAVISGQEILGGTIVGMAILHVHQSAEVWGRDALEFRPGRWLEGDKSETGSETNIDLDYRLVSFSRGPRMCFGLNLAWAEMHIAFATMIRRFELTIDGTTNKDMECIAAYYPRRHLHAWCQPT